MRFIYVDEAGISAKEEVAVVAGVIINADKDWKALENYLLAVRDKHIPPEHRKGFIFHAKDISAGNKLFSDRKQWPPHKRKQLIKDLLWARPTVGFSISVGLSRKEHGKYKNEKGYALVRHLCAYASCLVGCEQYMREFGEQGEVAMIIAEDTPTAKKHVKDVHDDLVSTEPEFPVFRELLPMRHIVDTVHFAEKARSPLLQFADACAFAFRRHLSGFAGAEEYMEWLIGPLGKLSDLDPDASSGYQLLVSTGPFDVQFAASVSP